jgi:hypothetical protein
MITKDTNQNQGAINMSPRNQKLSACVDGRLAAYATLAGVALAAPALAPSADASIVYSGVVNINVASTTSGVYLNVETGVNSPSPGSAPGWDLNPWNSSALDFFTPSPGPLGGGEMVGTGATYFNMTPGTLVSAASTFTTAGTTTINAGTPLNLNSSNNYMGFRFTNAASQVEFGWIQISLGASAGVQPRNIIGYAFENTGAGILVGDTGVPEPTTTALLGVMAAGALGVRAWRKRKAA